MPAARTIAILLLMGVLATMAPGARAADVYDQEKCSLCHIRQSVFFDGRFLSPGHAKEFGEERICSSCHNGVVSDQRGILWRGAQHPAPGGGEQRRCSRCHSPHTKGGGWGVLAGTSASIRRNSEAQCVGCHQAYSTRQGAIHMNRFPEGGCKECHRAHGGVGKSLLREGRETLCLRCHPTKDAGGKGGHPTALAGEESGRGRPFPECISCHPVHPRPGAVVKGGASLCATCHPALKEGDGKPNHPGVGDCLSCHVFHSRTGEGGRAFRGREIRPEILCARCHASYKSDTPKQAREKGMHVTKVGERQDLCFRCHTIHKAAAGTALLLSAKGYSCFECHDQQNSISETRGIVLSHPVFERVEKNRFESAFGKGKRLVLGPKGEIVCRTCHSVHKAAPGTALIVGGVGESAICFSCHEGMRGKAHVDPKIAKAGAGKDFGCDICHPVHGRNTLVDPGKGESPDDPWKKLCSDCHPRVSMHLEGDADRSTRRPADLPAFDTRGRAVRIGTISCPTCHQPHGMLDSPRRLRKDYRPSGFLCTSCHPDREKLALTPHDLRGIAGEGFCEPCHVPHGGTSPWMLGITPDPAASGPGEAICRSCHREKGLASPVAKAGHPMNIMVGRPIPTVYPLSNVKDGGVAGMLVCSSCHDVHGTGFVPVGTGTGKLLRIPADRPEETLTRNGECVPCHVKISSHAKADCISCHPPHQDTKPDSGCAGCHERKEAGTAARHIGKGTGCVACHRVHPKEGGGEKKPERVCIGCHPKTERIVGTPHGDIEGGPCGSCHPAHKDLPPPEVRRKPSDELFLPNLPCLRCHQEGGIAPLPPLSEHPSRKRKVPTNYGGSVILETLIPMVGRFLEAGKPMFPLYDEGLTPGNNGRIACLTCHDPHAGIGMSPDGKDRAAGAYLRDPSDNFIAEICEGCHRGEASEHVRKFHTLPRKEID
ncbi:MAG TPA: cytochrome c3 family protein [Candidatus Deferrimicrobiaceae bacterium]